MSDRISHKMACHLRTWHSSEPCTKKTNKNQNFTRHVVSHVFVAEPCQKGYSILLCGIIWMPFFDIPCAGDEASRCGDGGRVTAGHAQWRWEHIIRGRPDACVSCVCVIVCVYSLYTARDSLPRDRTQGCVRAIHMCLFVYMCNTIKYKLYSSFSRL